MKNKLIIYLLALLLLCGCSSTSKVTENGTVNATTRIAYNVNDGKIKVSSVIIKCNDNYYGVSVNDSINYNSNNNYFTTGSGLTVMITSDKLKTGSSEKGDVYTAVSKIEDNAYLYASGDKEKVQEIFNNVFKTNKTSYTFLAHDIDDDWTKEVNITDDVISFSNGTDTIYAYQNEGSLSDGCIDGRIEPTVFKKALRGIDIPITYPEDTNDEWDYIPYGLKEYEHLTIDGYTPYSAYQTTEYEKEMVGSIETKKEITKEEMANFILLAKDDQTILSLFNDKNEHTQSLYSLSIPSGNVETLDLTSNINLSDKKELAKSVINSENRYHFGVLTKDDEDGIISYAGENTFQNQEGYYVDYVWDFSSTGNTFVIANSMVGKIVVPTIRVSTPLYDFGNQGYNYEEEYLLDSYSYSSLSSKGYCYNDTNSCLQPTDYYYAASVYGWAKHGSENPINDYLLATNDITTGGNYHFVNEGDYAYKVDKKGNLRIYNFISTYTRYENTDGYEFDEGLTTLLIDTEKYIELPFEDALQTCSFGGLNGFTELTKSVGYFTYQD